MSVIYSNVTFGCGLGYSFAAGTAFRPFNGTFRDETAIAFVQGTAAGQVSKCWAGQIVVAAGTPALLDLSSLTDENGQAMAVTAIEAIQITNLSTTVGEDVTVGGGTNGLFAALPVALKAGTRGRTPLTLASPLTVDAAHRYLQLVAAAGTAVPVGVTLFGR